MEAERAVVLSDWPQPDTVHGAEIEAGDEHGLIVHYHSPNRGLVTVRFRICYYLTFGWPNDEALHGHPLWGRGLSHYAIHEVEHSSLIDILERRNAVHPRVVRGGPE